MDGSGSDRIEVLRKTTKHLRLAVVASKIQEVLGSYLAPHTAYPD
jgi:hypothetical protein